MYLSNIDNTPLARVLTGVFLFLRVILFLRYKNAV
nr:MAG TPA: hypothetical protein [Caudoviricetes sp.]